MKEIQKCYMCAADAITREHTPPEGFFPEGKRDNLIIVPSCKTHNLDNSKDVEYVRNIVVSELSTNSIARKYFPDKPKRSLLRREKSLFDRTFADRSPILIKSEEFPEGKETVFYTIDYRRLDIVFEAILHGRAFS